MTKTHRQEAIERLHEWIKPGDRVYTVLRHVSRSGMLRVIGVVLIKHDDEGKEYLLHPNYAVGDALGWRVDKQREGVRVEGAGMDIGYHLVYSLGQVLFNDGYALEHQWI